MFVSLFQVVSREIRNIVIERASKFNIALEDVSITNLKIGKEFTKAIEKKTSCGSGIRTG